MFKKVASGAALLVAARLICRALDFLALLVLARFLSPADFGLTAVAMTLILVVEAVLELPVGQVLVRLPALEAVDLDTAFTLAILRALILSLALLLLAWPFSILYEDSRLFGLICILSLAPALRGLTSPRVAVFVKQLNFKPDFLVEVCGKTAALAIGTIVAVLTSSFWAIVAATLATPATMVLVSYVIAPYRPRLSLRKWRVFASFLGWTSASQAVTAINWQCDRLLLGRFISHSQLGQFSIASDLSYIPLQLLLFPAIRSAMPAFVGLGSNRARMQAAYRKAVEGIAILTVPVVVGLALLAEPGIRLVLGNKWLGAAPILEWLALTVVPLLFVAPLAPLVMAMNRTSIFLRLNSTELLLKVPLATVGAIWFGIPGVVVVRLTTAVVMAFVRMACIRKLIGLSIGHQLSAPWRILASGGVMAIVLLGSRPDASDLPAVTLALHLGEAIILAGLSYGLALLALWRLSGCPGGMEALAVEHCRHAIERFRPMHRRPL